MTKIVFCIPGNKFTREFLECWSALLIHCHKRGDLDIKLSFKFSCNIFCVRNMCLGVNPGSRVAVGMQPFNGKLDYDYLMWIDSDQVFNRTHFDRILDRIQVSDRHIVSGTYVSVHNHDGLDTHGILESTVCKVMENDSNFLPKLFMPKLPVDKYGLIEIFSNGFGWMMVRRGVFEAIGYPWFRENIVTKQDKVHYYGEDVTFSMMARECGFKTYLDPTVLVGHEKAVVL